MDKKIYNGIILMLLGALIFMAILPINRIETYIKNVKPETVVVYEEKLVEVEVVKENIKVHYYGLNEEDMFEMLYSLMVGIGEKNPVDFATLLLITAKTESNMMKLKQDNGPARSLFQVEPSTEKDVYENYLKYNPKLKAIADSLKWEYDLDNLTYNLPYAAFIAYCCYKRYIDVPPAKTDKVGQAEVHKRYYNTHKGKATVEKTLEKI